MSNKINHIIKRLFNLDSIIISFACISAIIISIILYNIKSYTNGELVLIALTTVGFTFLFYININSMNIINSLKNDLQLRDETIMRLFNILSVKVDCSQNSNIELHRNTRDIVLRSMNHMNNNNKKVV